MIQHVPWSLRRTLYVEIRNHRAQATRSSCLFIQLCQYLRLELYTDVLLEVCVGSHCTDFAQ